MPSQHQQLRLAAVVAVLALQLSPATTTEVPHRVATGNGALTLEFSSAGTAAITAVHLGAAGPSVGALNPATAMSAGGFALREFPSGHTCSGDARRTNSSAAANESLLLNGNFSRAGTSSQSAANWSQYGLGYVRGHNGGDTTAITVRTTAPKQQAGALQLWAPPPGVSFGRLLLSGWSKAESDSGGAPTDYSVYADVGYTDGTWSFGHIAAFTAGEHDWQYSSGVIDLTKPVLTIHIYAMYRNRIGVVRFSDLSLSGIPVLCTPDSAHSQGSVTVIPGPNPAASAAVSLTSTVRPAGWQTDRIIRESRRPHQGGGLCGVVAYSTVSVS
eukprot:COSAG05_NODE_313_length_11620_cov_2.287301_1_plen_329_part_00